jgi:hypothetical protein
MASLLPDESFWISSGVIARVALQLQQTQYATVGTHGESLFFDEDRPVTTADVCAVVIFLACQ